MFRNTVKVMTAAMSSPVDMRVLKQPQERLASEYFQGKREERIGENGQ
ncbi:MAG TPA: hypothetical protein VEX13_10370 [Chloroflexia bacterium]|nr:hypothetical protein [Chloroflexia bacterium]